MFEIGDIVEIYSPVAGRNKYHLCVKPGSENTATQFLFLNSDPNFEQLYVVDCARVPCLPPSKTGKTAFSFALLPQFNHMQLQLYKARKLGELDKKLATELLAFAKTVTTMSRSERQVVVSALEGLMEKKTASS
jgi:hypothetical protein